MMEKIKIEKVTKDTLNEIASTAGADTIRRSKGNYIVRTGFFYTHGNSADKIAERITNSYSNIEIIRTWDQWKPFKGGDSVAHGSHFGVEFKINI